MLEERPEDSGIGFGELAIRILHQSTLRRRGVGANVGAEATLAAWTEGQPWLDVVSAHLTAQRDHLAARLAGELPQVGFEVPEATYLAWLDLRDTGLGDAPAKVLLKKARVGLSSGLDFGPRGAGFARLTFATSRELLDEMVDRIVGAVGRQ